MLSLGLEWCCVCSMSENIYLLFNNTKNGSDDNCRENQVNITKNKQINHIYKNVRQYTYNNLSC